jgi:nucleoside phosphorylase
MAFPVNVLYICARSEEDERLLDQLKKQLQPLKTHGLIDEWERRDMLVGAPVREELMRHLERAQIILLIVSPDFAVDGQCEELVAAALERWRQNRERVSIIPLLARSVLYEGLPFAELKIFPEGGRSLASLSAARRAEALTGLVREVRTLAQRLAAGEAAADPSQSQNPHAREPLAEVSLPQSSAGPRCDVLLVVATPLEMQAVREAALAERGGRFEPQYGEVKTYYYLGEIGGAATWLVQSEMGSGGVGGSTLTVSESIRQLAPASVVMVGIAFGLRPGQQQIGDILVSRQLMSYELQRVGLLPSGEDRVLPRGDRVTASPLLIDRFRDGCHDWSGRQPDFGLILSGEKLVDNPRLLERLRSLEPEAIGGEMEGAGLYAAAQLYTKHWIVVKAICDWGDGHKDEQKEQNQRLAATNAARFVFHVLRRGGLGRKYVGR